MIKNYNVLFVCDSAGLSGAEFVILQIMKNLNKDKFTPFVYCHENNNAMIEKVKALGIKYKTTSHFPDQKTIGRTGPRPSKIFTYLYAFIKIGIELIRLLKFEKIDIIHANAYPNCLYCIIPSLIKGKPLIWHVHNIRKIHRINMLIYWVAGNICSRIITVSDACKINLLRAKIKPSKFITIYNGMDLSKFNLDTGGPDIRNELGLSEVTKVIGLFGQPLPEKGHKYFIEAASLVLKELQNCVFLIVGYLFNSDYQKSLYNLVEKLGIQQNVVFLGWRDDISDIMASLDIMAHTRITPEPAALVLMEAMAMGKPIVATNTGGTPELVLDNVTGFVVPPKDSEALAIGIVELLKNSEKAKQMGVKGRIRVEKYFTLEKQILLIEKLYVSIVKHQKPGRV